MDDHVQNINIKSRTSVSADPIAYVNAVSATSVEGLLNPALKPDSTLKLPGIGAMVKMRGPHTDIFAVVSKMEIVDSGLRGPRQKLLHFDLIGEALTDESGSRHFHQGVADYPVLDDPVWLADEADIACVYACSAPSVRIGHIYQSQQVPANLITDEFLAKHFAILGSTGSGKSCSTALILHAILDAHPAGHVIMFDPHAEYSNAFTDRAEIFDSSNLILPHWLLNLEELAEFLTADDSESRQVELNILKKALKTCRELQSEKTASNPLLDNQLSEITVDSPVPYELTDLIRQLNNDMGALSSSSKVWPYLQILSRLESLMGDSRYAFMFSRKGHHDQLQEILQSVLRMPVSGKPISIMDLSGLPSEVVDVVISVLTRLIFDYALWTQHSPRTPILLVCEEAHRYLPGDESTGFAPTRRALGRIAKEGRKYGVSLGLITQRPSELSATTLSQCGTLISLRMSNESDQKFIGRALPNSAASLLEVLPALRPQEAIIAGQGVTVPMRVRFDFLQEERRPRSTSASFSLSWQQDHHCDENMRKTIHRWRNQQS